MKPSVLAGLALLACTADAATAALRTVALSGQDAPGAPAGAKYSQTFFTGAQYLAPAINNSGRTAFAAQLTAGGGVTAANDAGVWSEGGGALALIALEGSPTAGLPAGAFVAKAVEPVLNNAGQIGFNGLAAGGGINVNSNETVWTNVGGAVNVLIREASAAPGTEAGVTFGAIGEPALSHGGHAVFRSTLRGTGITAANDRGFWASGTGGLRKIARLGDAAPGFPAGVSFKQILPASPVINASGQVAFRTNTTGAGITTSNDGGVWIERNNALALVAREGGAAPSLPTGFLFATLGDPSLNRHGNLAFSATLTGAGVGTNNYSLWVERAGALEMAAREGQTAQGNVKFSTFGNAMLNERGDLAFVGATTGWGGTADVQDGIWIKPGAAGSSWRNIVTSGTTYGGLPAGVVNTAFINPVLNNAGQVAFLGTLSGPGVTAANDRALWVEGRNNQLLLVAREGDALPVAGGARTISSLEFVGGFNNEQGYRSGLNDSGEVAFLATFTDNTSGVFVSDVAKLGSSDFNGDGVVDGHDLLIWQRNLGSSGGLSQGDADGNGQINAADLAIWKSDAASVAAAAPVPEPAAWVAAALAAGALHLRRRRC